jgi:hypothetical protein
MGLHDRNSGRTYFLIAASVDLICIVVEVVFHPWAPSWHAGSSGRNHSRRVSNVLKKLRSSVGYVSSRRQLNVRHAQLWVFGDALVSQILIRIAPPCGEALRHRAWSFLRQIVQKRSFFVMAGLVPAISLYAHSSVCKTLRIGRGESRRKELNCLQDCFSQLFVRYS